MNKTPKKLWELLEQQKYSPETFKDEVIVSTDESKTSVNPDN